MLFDLIFLSALAETIHARVIAPLSRDVVFFLNGEPVVTATMKDDLLWVDLRADTYLAAITWGQTLTAQQLHITSIGTFNACAHICLLLGFPSNAHVFKT